MVKSWNKFLYQLDPNFMEHEVDEVTKNLDDSKCPGPDGIDGIIVKRACLNFGYRFLTNALYWAVLRKNG